jgi:putative MATE family efflux protein
MNGKSAVLPAKLLTLLWPLLIELVAGVALNFYSMRLASQISDQHAAALVLANQLFGTTFVFFRLFGAGISVVISQHLGANQMHHVRTIAKQSVAAVVWGAGALALALASAGRLVLQSSDSTQELVALTQPLLLWLAPCLILDAVCASCASVLRAHLRPRETMCIVCLMHAIHATLALLMSKQFGLAGLIFALLISRAFACGMYYLALHFRLGITCQLRDLFSLEWRYLREVLAIGFPAALENIGYQLAFFVSILATTKMGAISLATHAYVWQTSSFIVLLGAALGVCCEILVGRLVGQRDFTQAHALVKRVVIAGFCSALLLTTCVAFNGQTILSLFTQNTQIVHSGSTLLWIAVALEMGRTLNLIVINSLRGAGDVRFPVQAGLLSMIVILAGGSWLLGHYWGFGLVGIWLAYTLDECTRGTLMWRRWLSKKWQPKQWHNAQLSSDLDVIPRASEPLPAKPHAGQQSTP